jgi:hypothetical protein
MIPSDPTFAVRNWDAFQHYRNRTPPWVRLHRSLLNNREWHALSDGASKLLVECWLIASETMDGSIPLTATDLAWRLRRKESDCARWLKELVAQRFLVPVGEDASTVLASRGQDATPETETETETEEIGDANASPSGGDVQRVFAHWVRVTGRPESVKLTEKRREKIRARLQSYTADELITALDGLMLSDHHPQKPEWTDIVSCFGNDEKVENHIARARSGGNGLNGADRKLIRYRQQLDTVDLNASRSAFE